jgi:hypothetical protein
MKNIPNFYKKTMEKYAFICGAWGDIQVSLKEVEKTGIRKIIAATGQVDIENFLLAQDFIDEVIKIDFFPELWNLAVINRENLDEFLSNKIKKPVNVVNCAFNSSNNFIRYDLYSNGKIDEKSKQWAKEISQQLPEEFILFYPYSIGNSAPKKVHWPHWEALLTYLLKKSNNVVLCGQNIDLSHFDKYDNFYDLSNITFSFQQVFGLAFYAKQVITTHNGLSFFCVSNEFTTTVICNRHSGYFNGFNRSLSGKHVKKIDYNSTLLEAISILENDAKVDDIYEIISSFPYLYKDFMYEHLVSKNNDISQQIQSGKIMSIYSENEFNPIIFANMILKNKRFIYHIQNYNEQEEYKILENVKFFIEKYNRDIDFKFISGPILNYDLFLKFDSSSRIKLI